MLLAAGPFGLGGPELLIILAIVVLIFGVGRLSDVGGALGKSIREFRKASKDDENADALSGDTPASASSEPDRSASDTAFCTECGSKNSRSVKFCGNCGHPMGATVS